MNGELVTDIRTLSYHELETFLLSKKEQKFRARQIYEWLWKQGCHSFTEMTNIPVALRKMLTGSYTFNLLHEFREQCSQDGTTKTGFRLYDNLIIEGVLIPADGRTTACITSQAGCAMNCHFCATGRMGLYRNLTAQEMFDQVWCLNRKSLRQHAAPLSNIVLMGMGEPLMNYYEVRRALEHLTSPDGLGISPQRITLSTIGVAKMIRQLADDRIKVHLALSLHAASDGKRTQIIPFNSRNSLDSLSDALKYYYLSTRKRFTIEYMLLRDFNDTRQDARDVADFCRDFPVKINLIEFNPVEGVDFQKSEIRRMKAFKDFLESKNLVVNIRKSRGKDIDAACGQLAMKEVISGSKEQDGEPLNGNS